jgi:hypothetical protein
MIYQFNSQAPASEWAFYFFNNPQTAQNSYQYLAPFPLPPPPTLSRFSSPSNRKYPPAAK